MTNFGVPQLAVGESIIWVIFWPRHVGPDSVPIEGHGWVHSNVLLVTKKCTKNERKSGVAGASISLASLN